MAAIVGSLVSSLGMLLPATEGFRIHPATATAQVSIPSGVEAYQLGFELYRDDVAGRVAKAAATTGWLPSGSAPSTLRMELDATGTGGAYWEGLRREQSRGALPQGGSWDSRIEVPVPTFRVQPANVVQIPVDASQKLTLQLSATWSGCVDKPVVLEWSFGSTLEGAPVRAPSIRGWYRLVVPAGGTSGAWAWEVLKAPSMGGYTSTDAIDVVASCGNTGRSRSSSSGMRRFPLASANGSVTIPVQHFDFTAEEFGDPGLGGILPGSIAFVKSAVDGVPLFSVRTVDGRSGLMHLSRGTSRMSRYFDPLTSASGSNWDGSQAHFVWNGPDGTTGRSVERFLRPLVAAPADATAYSSTTSTPGAVVRVKAEFLNDEALPGDPLNYEPTALRLDYRRMESNVDGGERGRVWTQDGQIVSLPVRRDGRMQWGSKAPLRVSFQIEETRDPLALQGSVKTEGRLDIADPPLPQGDAPKIHEQDAGKEAAVESAYRVPSGAVTFMFSTPPRSSTTFSDPEVVVYPAGDAPGTAPVGRFSRALGNPTDKAPVTTVVTPGTWDFVGIARRDGKKVVFGRVRLLVREGDRLFLDFGAATSEVSGVPVGTCVGDQDQVISVRTRHETLAIKSISWSWGAAGPWSDLPMVKSFDGGYVATASFQVSPPAEGRNTLLVRTLTEEDDEEIQSWVIEVDKAVPPTIDWNGWTPPASTSDVLLDVSGKAVAGSNGILSGEVQRWNGAWIAVGSLQIGPDGTFAGSPPMIPGLNRFRVLVRDRCGNEGISEEFSVLSTNTPPQVLLACNEIVRGAAVGLKLTMAATGTDAESDPLRWSWSVGNTPIPGTSSTANWTVGSSEPFTVRACATDPLGQTACAECQGEPGSRIATMDCDLDPESCADPIHAPIDGPPFQGAMWNADAAKIYGVLKFCPAGEGAELDPFESERYLYLDFDEDASTGPSGFETRWTVMYLRKQDARSPFPMEIRLDRWTAQGWVPEEDQDKQDAMIWSSNGLRTTEPWIDGLAGPWELVEFAVPKPANLSRLRWYVDAPGYSESRDASNPYVFAAGEETVGIEVDGKTCDWMEEGCDPGSPQFGFEDLDFWRVPSGGGSTVISVTADVSSRTEGDQSAKLVTIRDGEAILETDLVITQDLRCATEMSFDLRLPGAAPWNGGSATARLYSTTSSYYQEFALLPLGPASSTGIDFFDGNWHKIRIALPQGLNFPVGAKPRLQIIVNARAGAMNLDNLAFATGNACILRGFPLTMETIDALVPTEGTTLGNVGDASEGSKALLVTGGNKGFSTRILLPQQFAADDLLLVDVKLAAGAPSWLGAIVATETASLHSYARRELAASEYTGNWHTIALPLGPWKDNPGMEIEFKLAYEGGQNAVQFDNVRIGALPPPPPPPPSGGTLLSGLESLTGITSVGGSTLAVSSLSSQGSGSIQVTGTGGERGLQAVFALPSGFGSGSVLKVDLRLPTTPGVEHYAGTFVARAEWPASGSRQVELKSTDYGGAWKTFTVSLGDWSAFSGGNLKLNLLYNGPSSTVHFDNLRVE